MDLSDWPNAEPQTSTGTGFVLCLNFLPMPQMAIFWFFCPLPPSPTKKTSLKLVLTGLVQHLAMHRDTINLLIQSIILTPNDSTN